MSRRSRRAVFFVYWLMLTAATHWPGLTLPPIVPRTDLWIHAGSFGVWTILLSGAEWMGSWRRGLGIAICGLLSLAWAGVDEVTQGLPGVNRVVAMSDFLANALGVVLATGLLLAVAKWQGRPGTGR